MAAAVDALGLKKKVSGSVGGADPIEMKPSLDAMVGEFHNSDAVKKKQEEEDAKRRQNLNGSAAAALGLRT